MKRSTGGRGISIGADIGGTFTDVIAIDASGEARATKVPSTPDDYSRGVLLGVEKVLDEMSAEAKDITGLTHGTTVAANAILEGKGAKTGLVTTAGFRDVLEMRRLRLPQLYNLQFDVPPPLVRRRDRHEIVERVGPNGELWQPLDTDSLARAVEKLLEADVEAVAVCLLHSYADSKHELAVEEELRRVLGPQVYISVSSRVLPAIREYDRTSTTVVNAYLGPTVTRYVSSLMNTLTDRGIGAPLNIMQSNGGTMSARAVVERPAYIIESGPAAGVIAAARVGSVAGASNLISLDMGGTTAKAAMIDHAEPSYTDEYEVGAGINTSSRLVQGGGYHVRLPFIEVSEIGAGGGSIVQVDAFGRVSVGPASAGAVPGPVCYGRGGTKATLTDALVVLGFLSPDALLDGEMPLRADLARSAIDEQVATPLGMSRMEAAYGVYTVALANMTRAVKAVSTYRGRDPRLCALIAFGGNGPAHAVGIAQSLGMRQVIIPRFPGVFSSLGLLLADVRQEFVQTVFRELASVSRAELQQLYKDVETQAREQLRIDGVDDDDIALRYSADLRYAGQAYELSVALDPPTASREQLILDFGREHKRTYGHNPQSDAVHLVNVRLSAGVANGSRMPVLNRVPRPHAMRGVDSQRQVYFGPVWGERATPILSRDNLAEPSQGPLIIDEYDSTAVVPPDCEARCDAHGNVIVNLGVR